MKKQEKMRLLGVLVSARTAHAIHSDKEVNRIQSDIAAQYGEEVEQRFYEWVISGDADTEEAVEKIFEGK